jgi:hypothetical protein
MTSNQYRVYYKGLRQRPTYEGLINYLATEQEMIQYPSRTAKHMRNRPYLIQLDGNEYDHMTEQQLAILRAKMNEDKLKEQAAKPGGPGTNQLHAAAAASPSAPSTPHSAPTATSPVTHGTMPTPTTTSAAASSSTKPTRGAAASPATSAKPSPKPVPKPVPAPAAIPTQSAPIQPKSANK